MPRPRQPTAIEVVHGVVDGVEGVAARVQCHLAAVGHGHQLGQLVVAAARLPTTLRSVEMTSIVGTVIVLVYPTRWYFPRNDGAEHAIHALQYASPPRHERISACAVNREPDLFIWARDLRTGIRAYRRECAHVYT